MMSAIAFVNPRSAKYDPLDATAVVTFSPPHRIAEFIFLSSQAKAQ